MSIRGALFRTAFVIISYYRLGYPGRGDSRPLCCVTVGTWTGAQEACPCILVFDDYTWEFPANLLLWSFKFKKRELHGSAPQPPVCFRERVPCAGISSCPWGFSSPQWEELCRRVSRAVRRVAWRPCCCFSKQKGGQEHPACNVSGNPDPSSDPLCYFSLLQHPAWPCSGNISWFWNRVIPCWYFWETGL